MQVLRKIVNRFNALRTTIPAWKSCIVLFLGIITPTAYPMGSELLSNPSLEAAKHERADGYVYLPIPGGMRGEAKCTITSDAHSGKNALLVTRLNDGGIYGIYPPFKKISPSDKVRYYKVSVWMKVQPVGGHPVAINIQCAKSDWSKGYHKYYGDVGSEWKEYVLLIKLDPGQDIGHFRICIGYGLTVNGDLTFLDDFSFREITADEFAKFLALQSARTNKRWKQVKAPAKETPGRNLLMNPSFENGIEHWGLSYTMQSRSRSDQMSWDSNEKIYGKHSLRYNAWPRWYEAGGRIQAALVHVKKGGTYTLSAYMKTNEPGIKTCLEVRESVNSSGAAAVSCPLTDKWKRFSMTFQVPKSARGAVIVYIAMPNTWFSKKDFSKRKVWIDAVQLEEGGLSGYSPSPVVEVVGNTSSPNALFREGETVKLNTMMTVPAALCQGGETKWKLIYKIENVFGDIVDKCSFEINPPAKGAVPEIKHSFLWKTKLLGSFCVHMSVKAGDKLLAEGINVFAIIPKLPEDIQKDSELFGLNSFSSTYLCGVAAKIGAGSIRLHDDNYLRWSMLQQAKGDNCWYEPQKDAILKNAKKAGIRILANMELGSLWATTALPKIKGYNRIKYPPQLGPWQVFVGNQARHFKDIVDAWEIWNEPYLQDWWKGTPKDYVDMLKVSYREIKKVDSELPVVGICGQLNSNGWNKDCLTLGAINFMDVFSYHMYISRNSGGPEKNWIKNVAENRKNLINAGKDVPIWNTEAGCSHESYYKVFYDAKQNVLPRISPAIIAQAYATSLAAGMKRLYWYVLAEDWGPAGAGGLHMLEYNGTPKPVIPAFAVCVKYLSGKKFVKKLELGKDTVCFLFKGKSKPVAVIWRSMGAKAIKAELSGNSVNVFNIMGNALNIRNGKIPVEISTFPVYVQGKGTIEQLDSEIKQAIH